MRLLRLMFGCLLVMIAATVAAQDDSSDVLVDQAPVDSITVEEDADDLLVTVMGNLPDGCTTISNVEINVDDRSIEISLWTERPLDLMCTQALVPYEYEIAVDVSDLEDGLYTVDVNGVTTEYARGITGGAQAAPDDCGPDDDETVVFRNRDLGYCLRVPLDATIQGTYPSPLMLAEPAAWIIISSAPADGRALDDITADIIARNEDATLTEITLDNQPAALIERLPESRELVVINAGTVFRFTLRSDEETLETADAFWTAVLDSFRFIPSEEVMPFEERALTITTLDDLNLELQLPEDWRIEENDGLYTLYAPEADTALVTFSVTDVFDEIEAAEADMLALTQGTGRTEPYFNAQELTGTVVYGVAGTCQEIILMGEPAFRQITVDPAACGAPNSTVIVDPVVRAILGYMQEAE
ncbi:MAG: hypothetical protein OHK0046_13720 [Anaerolineae bacterium]